MLDFVKIRESSKSRTSSVDVFPDFLTRPSKDLMIRGKQFVAIWDEEKGLWSTDEFDVQRLVDKMTFDYVEQNRDKFDSGYNAKLLSNFSSGKWTEWQKYSKSLPDHYHDLDSKIIFSNDELKKTSYATKILPYSIEESDISAYEKIISTLYDPSERQKIEWTIGAIIEGDSKWIQKFLVLYGPPGSGKSTILNIIEKLFEGYCENFDTKLLASSKSDFALEPLKNNPLVAIEHEGKLSKIEDNTKLNSIVSHDRLVVNAKFERLHPTKFHTFLILSTNEPVKITDAKSGLLRRLIDVSPSGRLISPNEYSDLTSKVEYELGGIAYHCRQVYKSMGPRYYNNYIPISMVSKTNDFFNFMEDNYKYFSENDVVELNPSWLRYKEYCEDARVPFVMTKRVFKDEMKNYFNSFDDLKGEYYGLIENKFNFYSNRTRVSSDKVPDLVQESGWLKFNKRKSLFDDIFKDCPAQYSKEDGSPLTIWDEVSSILGDLDTRQLHWVRVPIYLICIDFDLKDAEGNKSYELNLQAASKWMPTYAELSRSGAGIHLYYYYKGDPRDLSRLFDDNIEIKVFVGKSSLRRQVTKCNDIPIATISSGLPLKERRKMVTDETIKDEQHLRNLIKKALRKKVFPNTKPNIDYILMILNEAYESGIEYDISNDLANDIRIFAANSTHNGMYCLKQVQKMRFKSADEFENREDYNDAPIVIFDVESAPNHFLICWKKKGPRHKVVRMLDPKPEDVEDLLKFRLAGYNNRRYDNHMIYGNIMDYKAEDLFKLSQKIIIDHDQNAFFGKAWNLSYTDVYDFLSSSNKQGLKKWEIQLGIDHKEWDMPWDKPIPEDRVFEWMDYCCNDVIATEAVWDECQSDWEAREMLAAMSGLTVNDTTNKHTIRFIIGKDKNAKEQFIYTDLSTIFPGYKYNPTGISKEDYLPGVKIVSGKSIYHGKDPGEGGYAMGNPGMYTNVALLDVESMHPHSIIRLNMFGRKYTARFKEIVEARLAIKHKDYERAGKLLGGVLQPYLTDPKNAKKVANALKTAINSVYGLTSASFDNELRDENNVDNICAKYGALFMINLEEEVMNRGYKVVHIKTDSIKIANADNDIINFCQEYAKQYGFKFNHEATYEKICIVNDAVYIAKYASKDWCQNKYGYIPEDNEDHEKTWTATGKQFAVPYVFKTLFSHEKIEFKDMCEVFSVNSALYLQWPDEDPKFVGRIGQFTPVVDNGAVLLREMSPGKYGAVQGTKLPGKVPKGERDSYLWLESSAVKLLKREKDIDKSYYQHLVDDAVETISKYGNFEWFVSDDNFSDYMNVPTGYPEEVPFK